MVILSVFPQRLNLQPLVTKKCCPWFLWLRRVCVNLYKYPFLLCRNFRNCTIYKFGNFTHLQASTCCVFNIQVMSSQQTPQNYLVLELLNLIRAHKHLSDHWCFKELITKHCKDDSYFCKSSTFIDCPSFALQSWANFTPPSTFDFQFNILHQIFKFWEYYLGDEFALQTITVKKKKKSWRYSFWFSETIIMLFLYLCKPIGAVNVYSVLNHAPAKFMLRGLIVHSRLCATGLLVCSICRCSEPIPALTKEPWNLCSSCNSLHFQLDYI